MLRNKAYQLLDNLPPLPRASSSSDAAFISQILSSGTHQDQLSALVLLVRESPIHAARELGRLRAMTGWKEDGGVGAGGNKDQRIAVMKALADWWVTGGGKEKGKLRWVHPGKTCSSGLIISDTLRISLSSHIPDLQTGISSSSLSRTSSRSGSSTFSRSSRQALDLPL
jgi:hypothetical protein